MVAGVGGDRKKRGRIVREFGMNMYTRLYLKWITKNTYCTVCGNLLNVM